MLLDHSGVLLKVLINTNLHKLSTLQQGTEARARPGAWSCDKIKTLEKPLEVREFAVVQSCLKQHTATSLKCIGFQWIEQ